MKHGILLFVAALLLAGCARDVPAEPRPFDVPTSPPAPTTSAEIVFTPEEEELYGPRVVQADGLVLKQLGKVAQYGGPGAVDDKDTWGVRVVVDSIEVDPTCDEYVAASIRGHRLLLSLRVETSDLYDPDRDQSPLYYAWSTVGPDGVSEAPMSTYSPCRAATELPSEMRPSAKYRGTVHVDTANPSGQLVFRNYAAWNYPTG